MVWWVAVCMQFVYYPYTHTQWRDDAVVPSICLYVCLWTSLHAVKKTSELLLSSSLACPFFDSIVRHYVTEWVSIFLHPLSQSWKWNLQTLFHLNTHVTSGIRKDICQHSSSASENVSFLLRVSNEYRTQYCFSKAVHLCPVLVLCLNE